MQSLTPFHTFHLPVAAKQIIEFHTTEELLHGWQRAQAAGEPVLLLGQGSNMLFLDDFQGTVLVNRLAGIEHREDENFHYLHVAGGENWHNLVQWSLEQGISGLENLALIPGVAGSAPVQNIGAYGVEFEKVCDYVDVLNLQSGEQFRLAREECAFGYRESVFKHRYSGHYAVVAVGLKLAKNWQPVLSYGSLKELNPASVTPRQIFDEVCAVRRAKLPNPDETGNAGSFFKNPVVSGAKFAEICKIHPEMPHYPQPNGDVKLPAGWLIDQCGLKGTNVGGAMVHTKQALVLVNTGTATGEDVRQLAREVRRAVKAKFDVEITPEVRFIGAFGEVDSAEATE